MGCNAMGRCRGKLAVSTNLDGVCLYLAVIFAKSHQGQLLKPGEGEAVKD